MYKREPIGKKLRFSIFERDKFSCTYCGRTPEEDDVVLHVDHVISVKDGGDNDKDNLVTSCFDCNSGKGAKSVLRGKQTVENLQEELDSANERLEQLKRLTKLRKKLSDVNKKSDTEKIKWIVDAVGEGYNDKLYKKLGEQITKYHSETARETLIKALEITTEKNDSKNFDDISNYVRYFSGVVRNLVLSPEEQKIVGMCNRYFTEHFTKMFPYAKKMLLDHAFLGEEFFKDVIEKADKIISKSQGETFLTRDFTKEYSKVGKFTVTKSGYNFNTLFCESIAIQLEID